MYNTDMLPENPRTPRSLSSEMRNNPSIATIAFKQKFLQSFGDVRVEDVVKTDLSFLEEQSYSLDDVINILYRIRMSALIALNGIDIPREGESKDYPAHFLVGFDEKVGFSALGKEYPEGQLSDVCENGISRNRYYEWEIAAADDCYVGGILLFYYNEQKSEWVPLAILNHLTLDLIGTFGLFRRDGRYAFPPELAILLMTLFDPHEYQKQRGQIDHVVDVYRDNNPLPIVPGYNEWVEADNGEQSVRLQVDRQGTISFFESVGNSHRLVFEANFDGKHRGITLHLADREETVRFEMDDDGALTYVWFLSAESKRVFLQIGDTDKRIFLLIHHVYEDIKENGKGFINRDILLLSDIVGRVKTFSSLLPERSSTLTMPSPWK